MSAQIALDTADISEIRKIKPKATHATNNPSLLLAALPCEEIAVCLNETALQFKKSGLSQEKLKSLIFDHFLVRIGLATLDSIEGTLSTQIDPRLAYDLPSTLEKARQIISLFEDAHIPRERIFIKIPATWEGCEAAKILEKENIQCNLTLIFSWLQAYAAAQAKASMIAPYVGRVSDWVKKKNAMEGQRDAGVDLVLSIQATLREMPSATQVMAASFRTVEQIYALSSCDYLTIHPKFFKQLDKSFDILSKPDILPAPIVAERSDFNTQLSQNMMANELMTQGLERFVKDTLQIETQIHFLLQDQ